MRISSTVLRHLAHENILHRSPLLSRSINRRQYRDNFGCSAKVASYCWNCADKKKLLPPGFRPTHLLWTFLFLKLYCCETVAAILCGCDEKTIQKWVWMGIGILQNLDLVSGRSTADLCHQLCCFRLILTTTLI